MRLMEVTDPQIFKRATDDFIHNIAMITTRGHSLFDMETHASGFGYTIVVTAKVPSPTGYWRATFMVQHIDGGDVLRRTIVDEHLGGLGKESSKQILDITDPDSMSSEQYIDLLRKHLQLWRILLGSKTLEGLINKWTGTAYAWKLLRLISRNPPPSRVRPD